MIEIVALPSRVTVLGRLGENEHRLVKFPISDYSAMYPNATYTLLNLRPGDAAAYPVANTAVQGGYLLWTIASTDLTKEGQGKCELLVMDGDVVAKSVIYLTSVLPALDGSGTAPEPWESWQERFAGLVEDAEDAASAAAQSATSAATSAEQAVDASQAVQDMGVGAETLTPGSAASVTKTVNPSTGAVTLGLGIPQGEHGLDGVSPTATVIKSGNTATITITDKNGTTTAEVEDGQDGAPGEDGVSPTVAVTDITGGHRVSITDAQGTQTFDVMDGTDGTDGTDAYVYIRYSATEPTSDSDMKTTPDAWIGIYSGDAASAPTHYTDYTWYKIKGETGPISDVQVNGTSVVSGGVANVPIATSSRLGVIFIGTNGGLTVQSDGRCSITPAPDGDIKAATTVFKPIIPSNQYKSVFYGLAKAAGDSTQSASANAVGTYTEDAKSAISEMLNGSVAVSGTTPTITAKPGIRYVCGEVVTLDITTPASGIVDVVFESGSTATVLTVTPPSGVTAVKWAGGFDPSSLDADTVYCIRIMDGKYASVQSWA